MKKVIKILLIYFCFLTILLVTSVDASTGKVTSKSVRLRKENNTSSAIITNIKKDETIEIIGEKENWYNVKYKNFIGYVSKDYIELIEEKIEEQPITETEKESTSEVKEEIKEESIVGKDFNLQKDVKLRLNPNFSSIVLENITNGSSVKVTKELGKWIEISVNNKIGWICNNNIEKNIIDPSTEEEPKDENVQVENTVPNNNEEENTSTNITTTSKPVENKTGYVNVETVNVRETASLSGKRLGFLDLNDEVTIIAEEGDWYKVKTKEYGECYIYKSLVSPNKVASRELEDQRDTTVSLDKNNEVTSSLTQGTTSSNQGEQIVEFAKQYLGYAYVYAGKKPETGFDCSGFTRYVYLNFGISLGSTAASQANNSGVEVARTDLQIGDLILFQDDARTRIGHCGIYIGNNMFIHAANPKRGVVTDKLEGNSYYSPRFVSAYRF